jgi:hypothetical protein
MHFVKEKIIEARFLSEIYDVTRHQFVFRSITSAMYAWQNSYMYYGMDSFIMYKFITSGCESSAPFFVIYKAGHEPMPYW